MTLTTAQRGLGGPHEADKRRLKRLHRDGDPCWRCGQPMYKWQALDRGHIIDRALGGANGPAVLEHASCNRSAGATAGNLRRPRFILAASAPSATCHQCGQTYHYRARTCEICGCHYHPSRRDQRTCGRACGVVLQRRNKMAAGWLPRSQRPKPAPRPPPEPYAPRSSLAYYTCRYCGKQGVARAKGQQREVCPAKECQLLRLKANNWRVRYGMTADEADAAVMSRGRQDNRLAASRRW